MIKQYHAPATPCERLLASDRVSSESKKQLRRTLAALDPVKLLHDIRQVQRELVALEMRDARESAALSSEELGRFVASLSTAWRDGGRCGPPIASVAGGRGPGGRDWTPSRRSGRWWSSGWSSSRRSQLRNCLGGFGPGDRKRFNRGNCARSKGGSNTGAVRPPSGWSLATEPPKGSCRFWSEAPPKLRRRQSALGGNHEKVESCFPCLGQRCALPTRGPARADC